MTDVSKEGARGTSGADDLRNHFAQDLMQAAEDGKFDSWHDLGDRLMALIAEAGADPVRRLALLDAMGLDVREGWRDAPYAGVYSVACGAEPMPNGKYLVVRSRGEARGSTAFDPAYNAAGVESPPASDPFLGDPDAMFEGPA